MAVRLGEEFVRTYQGLLKQSNGGITDEQVP